MSVWKIYNWGIARSKKANPFLSEGKIVLKFESPTWNLNLECTLENLKSKFWMYSRELHWYGRGTLMKSVISSVVKLMPNQKLHSWMGSRERMLALVWHQSIFRDLGRFKKNIGTSPIYTSALERIPNIFVKIQNHSFGIGGWI